MTYTSAHRVKTRIKMGKEAKARTETQFKDKKTCLEIRKSKVFREDETIP